MYLQYGDTTLHVIDLQRYERENVYSADGADLLYVRHTLGVVATYAPGGVPAMVSVTSLSPDTRAHLDRTDPTVAVLALSPRGANPGGAATVGTPTFEGNFPASALPAATGFQRSGPETDAELRYRLLLPRQKLILWAYDRQTGKKIAWLESPRPKMLVDADNGPRPLALDVVGAAGEPHSLAIHFQIETCLTPCPVGSDRFVLSHRWEMSHTHDEDNYLTRVITGTVVFHPGVARLVGGHPDLIRNQFLHPIPLGFRRTVPEIKQSSDGLTIEYTITDTDPLIVFAPGDSGASQIDIQETFRFTSPPLANLMSGGATPGRREWFGIRPSWI